MSSISPTAMPPQLFDAHVHVVGADATKYPRHGPSLPNGAWWEDEDASVEVFQRRTEDAAIVGVALVQATGTYGADNSYLVDALAREGTNDQPVLVGVGVVDPTAPDAIDHLTRLVDHGIRGIRLFHIPTPTPPWLDRPEADALVDAAADLGCVINICIQNHDFGLVAHHLDRRPDVTFTLDHCGFPELSDGPPFADAEPLWKLAEHENLHVKFSPTLAALASFDASSDDDAAELVLAAVADHFGPDRVMLGTDWPQHREPGLSYAGQVDRMIRWTAAWSDADRTSMLAANTAKLFGL